MTPIRIEIGVQKPETKEIVWLSYELLDHPFSRKWLAATLRELDHRKLWGCRFGALCVDEADSRHRIKQAFERLITSLPESKKTPFSELRFEAIPYIPRQKIESLLKLCATTIAAPDSSSRVRENAKSLAGLLRYYIQLYFPEFHYHVSLKTFAPSVFELPKEADQLFTVDRHDGWLYLDYEGQGLDAMASFDEHNIVNFEPQTRFSNCAQLLYRDEFDGQDLDTKVRDWLVKNLISTANVASAEESSNASPNRLNIGLIPLARPTHGLHRHVVRDLFSSIEVPIEFRAFKDGKPLLGGDLASEITALTPWHPWGGKGLAIAELFRLSRLQRPAGLYLDGYHRFGGLFWFIKKPIRPFRFYVHYQIRTGFYDYRQYARYTRIMAKVYLVRTWTVITAPIHWARPHAFNLYFKVSRPVRKLYYFVSFQFRKRILGRGDKP